MIDLRNIQQIFNIAVTVVCRHQAQIKRHIAREAR